MEVQVSSTPEAVVNAAKSFLAAVYKQMEPGTVAATAPTAASAPKEQLDLAQTTDAQTDSNSLLYSPEEMLKKKRKSEKSTSAQSYLLVHRK